jgi:ribosomal protein S27E
MLPMMLSLTVCLSNLYSYRRSSSTCLTLLPSTRKSSTSWNVLCNHQTLISWTWSVLVSVFLLLCPSLATSTFLNISWSLPSNTILMHVLARSTGCFAITTVFSHAQTVVVCSSCTSVLCQPTGGKARLTEGVFHSYHRSWPVKSDVLADSPLGCSFRKKN